MTYQAGAERARALLEAKDAANRKHYAETPVAEAPSRQVVRRRARANDYWRPGKYGRIEAPKSHQPTKRMMRRRTENADGSHSYRGNLP